MSLVYPDIDKIKDVDEFLSLIEIEYETQIAPAMCSVAYRGIQPARISSSNGLYYLEREGVRVQLCKSRFRVLASPGVLMQVGAEMTHTELLVQRATYQFMLGYKPIVPYVYYIPKYQLSYCEMLSVEFSHKIMKMMVDGICDMDPAQYDPTTLEPADEMFVDRRDKNDNTQADVDDLAERFLCDEIKNITIIAQPTVASKARADRLRKHGYVLSVEGADTQYFPPFQDTAGRHDELKRPPEPGVWLEKGARHVMTPPIVSTKLCDVVMKDEATYVIDAFCGYGSDSAYLHRLPVALEVSDVDVTRVEATIQNIFRDGEPTTSGIMACTKNFSSVMADVATSYGTLSTREKILVYVDPPWVDLVIAGGEPYDFILTGGRLSSYLATMSWVSFVVKVPYNYNAAKLVDIRAVTGEYTFPECGLKLLYYERNYR